MSSLFSEDVLKLSLSLIMGSLIGIEREYRSKAAGFRTITLISIGSTLFTIVSIKLGGIDNADRIAANIITGIGFIGAGVVFKDALTITGLTTATSIWATSALGMAIGSGDYNLAVAGLIFILIVLSLFEYVQGWIDAFHQKRSYKIIFIKNSIIGNEIENTIKDLKLKSVKRRENKQNDEVILFYDVYGSREKIDQFNFFLLNFASIKSFEC